MKRPNRPVPRQTIEDQARASDPENSAWVSANAGSGKTHVLSKRVIRLLLDGCEPAKILCLTYTRAAAANMANRVFTDLAAWAMLDDAELGIVSYGISGRPAQSAVELLRERGIKAGQLNLKTLWPFPDHLVREVAERVNRILVPELNMGQLVREIERAAGGRETFGATHKVDMQPGDVFVIETPGGGGYGTPGG